ncbi:MAG TPA: uracil-DNA glycosylase, partial [Caulobacter sp.]|nr:uracil-DNA glycosylase [Caulobacter sp.]
MVAAQPARPPGRGLKSALEQARESEGGSAPTSLEDIAAGIQVCRRCDLWRNATQGVPGLGPARAALMIVGEQPGDQED